MQLTTLIPIIFLAFSLACLYTYYRTGIIGDFIRALANKGAESEQTALSVDELCDNGIKKIILNFSLSKSTTLKRFVGTFVDGEIKRYYLIPEGRSSVLARFDSKGMSFVTVIICIAVLAAFSAVAYFLAPFMQSVIGDYTQGQYVPDDYIIGEELEKGSEDEEGYQATVPEGEKTQGRYDTVE